MVNYDVLRVNDIFNGHDADIGITDRGSKWLWAVCAIMGVASLAFMGMSFMRPRPRRIWNYLTATICFISAISYFSMASHLGWTPIDVQFNRADRLVAGRNREIYYVRYIDWFVTTPLILLTICLTAALPWHTIMVTLLLGVVMVVTGLAGALTRTSYKWGFFTFACIAMIAVFYKLLAVGTKHAAPLGADVKKAYTALAAFTVLIWSMYPIAWGLSEGGNVIAPDSEMIFYGILDLLSKVVFGLLVNMFHTKIEPARLGLHLRNYDDVVTPTGQFLGEKHHNGVAGTTGDHV